MKNTLIEIYIGSDIESKYIASLLRENNINSIIQNTLEESMSAGWALGSPDNCTVIRIDEKDYKKAIEVIEEYKNTRKVHSSNRLL